MPEVPIKENSVCYWLCLPNIQHFLSKGNHLNGGMKVQMLPLITDFSKLLKNLFFLTTDFRDLLNYCISQGQNASIRRHNKNSTGLEIINPSSHFKQLIVIGEQLRTKSTNIRIDSQHCKKIVFCYSMWLQELSNTFWDIFPLIAMRAMGKWM